MGVKAYFFLDRNLTSANLKIEPKSFKLVKIRTVALVLKHKSVQESHKVILHPLSHPFNHSFFRTKIVFIKQGRYENCKDLVIQVHIVLHETRQSG